MSDMDTKIPELLRSLADDALTDAPNDPRRGRATLRRARRRRALTASGTALAVAALVTGGVLGVRAFRPSTGITPARSPEPSAVVPVAPAFEGIWPESTAAELETAQQAVDEGHSPWQLDPGQTAVAFATNLLGWSYDATSPRVVQLVDGTATVRISNSALGPRVPPITVVLWQLGRIGPMGVWTVVKVGSPVIDQQVTPYPLVAGGNATVSGRLQPVFEGSTVRVDLLTGPALETEVAGGEVPGWAASAEVPAEQGFEGTWPIPLGTVGDQVTLLIRNVDATGTALAASAFAVPLAGSTTPGVPTIVATPSPGASVTLSG
jgi:hypothetical protein